MYQVYDSKLKTSYFYCAESRGLWNWGRIVISQVICVACYDVHMWGIVCFPRSMWKTIWQKDRFVKYVLKSPLLRRVERNVTRVLILSDTDLSHGKGKAGGELPRRPPMAEFCPFFPKLKSPTNTTSQLWLLHKITFEMSHVKNYGVNWYCVFEKLVANYDEISN